MIPSTQSPGAPPMSNDRDKHQSVVFVSTCPKCNCAQSQRGFSRAALERLLQRDHPIEGYCVACDEFWSLSLQERAAIATAVTD